MYMCMCSQITTHNLQYIELPSHLGHVLHYNYKVIITQCSLFFLAVLNLVILNYRML